MLRQRYAYLRAAMNLIGELPDCASARRLQQSISCTETHLPALLRQVPKQEDVVSEDDC